MFVPQTSGPRCTWPVQKYGLLRTTEQSATTHGTLGWHWQESGTLKLGSVLSSGWQWEKCNHGQKQHRKSSRLCRTKWASAKVKLCTTTAKSWSVCVCVSHPSSTKDAFRLSRGAWDKDRVVITSSRKPTSNFRSSSCTEIKTHAAARQNVEDPSHSDLLCWTPQCMSSTI